MNWSIGLRYGQRSISDAARQHRPVCCRGASCSRVDDVVEIGRGGFGVVYKCRQPALERTVAVKVLTAALDDSRERFLREQRAMGRLTGHPNIVGVLHVGETETGYPYLVMHYHKLGSLADLIRRRGSLALNDVLRLGVKMAGALETAHDLEILHRDIKPANILLTDYGEPALSDFGLAHISSGFTTASGVYTGTPAFTAPEIIGGMAPSRASDVYGLGSTLFCALTGHAAFERRTGEQLVAQFLRIASESVPDLRDGGISDDITAIIEQAMSRDPQNRPGAADLGVEIQQVQYRRGLEVDQMALQLSPRAQQSLAGARKARSLGNLPLQLTSFVGRRNDVAEVRHLVTTQRLVTLTGIGGVGKTRLALRVAADIAPDFTDGVWLVELGELHDSSLLTDVVAAAVGLRDQSVTPLPDALGRFLSSRKMLLILDNCEHLVDAAAKLAENLLQTCPYLTILATSREALSIGGESVWLVPPLMLSAADSAEVEPIRVYDNDAMALFAIRAAAALHGFEITEQNKATVARICSRVDGLPLALELAAARLKAMSLDQIEQRLSDRFLLLSHGTRGAPTRQQALEWSIDWSYDLCTSAEQELWARLSVFAGNIELEAAEAICAGGQLPVDLVDLVSSLVDKSILIRISSGGVVRFRMLETLRHYGRQKMSRSQQYAELLRRHLHWCQQLAIGAWSEWASERQVYWIRRIEREMPNIREALELSLLDAPAVALSIAASLHPFWLAHGMLSEGRRWLERALAAVLAEPTVDRVNALYGASTFAGLQGDLTAQAALVDQARELIGQIDDPLAHGIFGLADGLNSVFHNEIASACARLEGVVDVTDDPIVQIPAMALLGWALQFRADNAGAVDWHERALALSEEHGESVYRSYVLWSLGVAHWQTHDIDRAAALLREGLQWAQGVDDARTAASCIEALAWITDEPERAAVLMGAAQTLGFAAGSSTIVFPRLAVYHEQCERRTSEALGDDHYAAVSQEGAAMSVDDAVDYALRN
ncbi:protein kinase domain-containing protein [Mycobacterium sp. 48b]|uniref:protein kinase domain-containing protein n=1 Tax=Mycobacterium sp. 48b TaxID=3400426 RepID=UPI003AADEC13